LGEKGVKHCIIFDFDGVVADSEVLANTELAAMLTEHGLPTTLHDSYDRYMGKRWADSEAAIVAQLGKPLPPEFRPTLQARTRARFANALMPVTGVVDFIAAFKHHAHAVASSSSPEYLASSLQRFELAEHFGANVFSATMVARGKPDPDIFFLAASQLKAHPDQCLVFEDSPTGVRAGRAAGMTTIGLLAGSHIRPGHGEQLRAAGANHVVNSYAEAKALLHRLDVT
jgi:HAD superfamily hydrolase (TIGR01509 family)